MTFKDKFKSIFLAEVEENEEKPISSNQAAQPVVNPVVTPSVDIAANGEVNQKMVDGLYN
jgi:hypothetical protein